MSSPDWNMNMLMKGASILTISAMIVKILGAVCRVPFKNLSSRAVSFYGWIVVALISVMFGASAFLYVVMKSRIIEEEWFLLPFTRLSLHCNYFLISLIKEGDCFE